MKLGMLIPEFPTQTHIFFWREILALRSLGVDVRLLSTRRPSEACPHQFARLASDETHYLYPPSITALASLALSPLALLRAGRYLQSLSESGARRARVIGLVACAADLVLHARRVRVDHLHVHSCADAAHVAALARLMGGPPYSLHLHGDLSVYGRDHAQKARLASFVAAAAGPMEQQLAREIGLPSERRRTLPMGVNTTSFSPLLDPRDSEGGPLRLVTVARLSEGKGHRYALAALRDLLDRGVEVTYTIIGSGPDRGQIEAQIAELRLADRVRFTGSLREEAVLAELRSADVFLLPSVGVFEASPVAVMEAMSCGVPVVASRIGGTPDMIADGVDGFLVGQGNVADLAAAIQRLARDPALRRSIAVAARNRAVEAFDSRARARQLVEAIQSTTAPSAVAEVRPAPGIR